MIDAVMLAHFIVILKLVIVKYSLCVRGWAQHEDTRMRDRDTALHCAVLSSF